MKFIWIFLLLTVAVLADSKSRKVEAKPQAAMRKGSQHVMKNPVKNYRDSDSRIAHVNPGAAVPKGDSGNVMEVPVKKSRGTYSDENTCKIKCNEQGLSCYWSLNGYHCGN